MRTIWGKSYKIEIFTHARLLCFVAQSPIWPQLGLGLRMVYVLPTTYSLSLRPDQPVITPQTVLRDFYCHIQLLHPLNQPSLAIISYLGLRERDFMVIMSPLHWWTLPHIRSQIGRFESLLVVKAASFEVLTWIQCNSESQTWEGFPKRWKITIYVQQCKWETVSCEKDTMHEYKHHIHVHWTVRITDNV